MAELGGWIGSLCGKWDSSYEMALVSTKNMNVDLLPSAARKEKSDVSSGKDEID